ncbi:hypothetical protein R3P38DRAFT_3180249 [Favolaschia claudopus]|uniref:Ricin B lectin domain-containing protein n=1 Tax=Favolaschia claudopus TaxID=2862362 RepID=A0AAW0CPP6_9AGAR
MRHYTAHTDGSKVIAWAPHKPSDGKAYGNQVWEIRPSKNEGCYTIANAKTGTYLEAVGGLDVNGEGIDGVQVTCSKATGEDIPSYQEWMFLQDPTGQSVGSYAIGNVATELLVDVEGGSSTNGTRIQIHCAAEQIGTITELFWLIEPAEYSKPGAQTAEATMPADTEVSQNAA